MNFNLKEAGELMRWNDRVKMKYRLLQEFSTTELEDEINQRKRAIEFGIDNRYCGPMSRRTLLTKVGERRVEFEGAE